jgi:hypothetical protein
MSMYHNRLTVAEICVLKLSLKLRFIWVNLGFAPNVREYVSIGK